MIAAGVPGRLRRGPAILLWLEAAVAGAAVAGAAVVTGLRPVMDSDALLRAAGQACSDRLEAARRVAIGALFGLHTMRFRIYLQPDSGRKHRDPQDESQSPSPENLGGAGKPLTTQRV